jgi:uncharacterized protein
MSAKYIVIGVLSDTHNRLSSSVLNLLTQFNPSQLIHAGDVGSSQVIETLNKIAPTTFIRGNTDPRNLAPETAYASIADKNIYIIHDLLQLDLDPKTAQIDLVISGHTHFPKIHKSDDLLFLNPGSASFSRGPHPPSIAILKINHTQLLPKIYFL